MYSDSGHARIIEDGSFVRNGSTVHLDASDTTDDEGIDSYDWEFWYERLDQPVTDSGKHIHWSETFTATPTDVTFKLIVTDTDGNTASATKSITASEAR